MSGCGCGSEQAERLERRTLQILLTVNAIMFVLEFTLGWWAESTGLIADSLDMCADALIYGISLYAVGQGARAQATAATASGWLQILLGIGVLVDVVRRLVLGSEPESLWMMGVGCLALIANLYCLMLISRHRDAGIHMRASFIFSANDVLANLGVVIAGLLVMMLGSAVPDLIAGLLIS
ncbi:cation transporter, partial [Sedimenticola sp.]|uniref:cation transporter n=1 Tax=Sedimenticola sp. TaxID=1940285 RepID=UPI003D0CAEF5